MKLEDLRTRQIIMRRAILSCRTVPSGLRKEENTARTSLGCDIICAKYCFTLNIFTAISPLQAVLRDSFDTDVGRGAGGNIMAWMRASVGDLGRREDEKTLLKDRHGVEQLQVESDSPEVRIRLFFFSCL